MENVTIRQETVEDYEKVFELITAAFQDEEYTDHREQYLVERLRKSVAFVTELSLVAEINGRLVGHILLSKITIRNEKETYGSLALAPVSVAKNYRKQGIGGDLIKKAHKKAYELGFDSVILLGHADYYPRFGYQSASKFGIRLPFDAPDENFMALELRKDGLKSVSGRVEYPPEFFE